MQNSIRNIRTVPSLLDRLLDFEPRTAQDPPKSALKNLREIKQSLKRDLEWLLNTRCHFAELSEITEELKKSVLTYGIPDFTGISFRSHLEQNRLLKVVENAIRTYEPRLTNLKVSLEPFSETNKVIKLCIEGILKIDPATEQVTFDTILQLGNGEFEVKER